MLKKITLLAISVGALVAFAAPAVAQAQQLYELNVKQHVSLNNGAKVTATATDLTTHTVFGTLTCKLVTIHGEVLENNANTVRIGNNSVTVEGCNVPITNPSVGQITIVKAETVGIAHDATFVAHIPPPAEVTCHYTGDIPFSYAHDTDTLTVTGANQFTGTPNPPCGTGTMTGSFTLETSDGTTVFME
jgi:hypothetical protein